MSRGFCFGREGAVTPSMAAFSLDAQPWKEREKGKKLLLKTGSLPVVPGELEGSERSEKGLGTQAESREGEPEESQGGGGETTGYGFLSNSSGQGRNGQKGSPTQS